MEFKQQYEYVDCLWASQGPIYGTGRIFRTLESIDVVSLLGQKALTLIMNESWYLFFWVTIVYDWIIGGLNME